MTNFKSILLLIVSVLVTMMLAACTEKSTPSFLTPYDAEIDDYGVIRFTITQNQIDVLIKEVKEKNYTSMTDKIEYICDSNWEIFKNRGLVQLGTATKTGSVITMSGWKNAVAYEVYEEDTLIFVSNRVSFTLENPATSNTKVYAVAYNGDKTEVIF